MLKDTIYPLQLLKNADFSIKTTNKYHHISLNSQFNTALKGIVCFSVRFCDNSLLMLEMRFQAFCFASKMVQGFSGDRKMLTLL